ncbi:hypothetical protein [Sinomicrobium weinanense]|uniref:Uncharacterized protein n=1 Tax=Sinomicrobium weinanense TaxID=2842200 RepID=A0A926JR50_9FLAO|nr:hypothetical protein [Sinomicrobium weinanense]MBC9795779.1 hypothetical protein [Sinomicrobium weinanense]MBU3121823.1 hypothetical protein [Sinomicrobium weinanense]
MKNADMIPNYYGYTLKVNGNDLSPEQRNHFFNCINKVYRNNDKFIYRGDKKEKLYSIYGLEKDSLDEQFRDTLFILGAKANMFLTKLPGINEINIDTAGNNVFNLIFKMLSNLLKREFPFGPIHGFVVGFRKRETGIIDFFCNRGNEQVFIDIIGELNPQQQIVVRDYYLGLLHHISKSEYYASSFLLSTSTDFSQAYKFAWRGEEKNSENPLILFGWVPYKYEGVLSVPDSRALTKKINMETIGLPVYEKSFFPYQKEVTLKGGLLPHYLLGYLRKSQEDMVFEINPALFETGNTWNGIELPVDQSAFHQRIQNTLFGRYFTLCGENNQFRQHEKM